MRIFGTNQCFFLLGALRLPVRVCTQTGFIQPTLINSSKPSKTQVGWVNRSEPIKAVQSVQTVKEKIVEENSLFP